MDAEADAFARELLMPAAMLKDAVRRVRGRGRRLTEQQVSALSKEFAVPVLHMLRRLLDLKLIKLKDT